MSYFFFFSGALLAGLAIAIGAYSTHSSTFDEVQLLWLEKGARYQMYHAIGLLLAGLALARKRKFQTLTNVAGACFIGGIICFSGSLYAMTFTPFEAGYITPAGGLLFMIGWILLAFGGPGK
ncbi:MAG: DUF423 domain-containing protein [Desulfofustis sp.]|nr:DUF423 domain-containing protein [Desulfofustis sp.]